MNRRKPACLLIIFLIAFNFHPQEICGQASLPKTLTKPLTIGDTVPDVVLENITNYPSSSARLSDFKGKLVVIDFFATNCFSCIRSLPKMESLQKEFASSLQVLVVTQEPPAKIDRLKERNKVFASVKLPIIISDSVLSTIFPYISVPHHVWLFNNKVLAITHDSATSAQNIASFLAGQMPVLPFKYDNVNYNRNEVLLVNNNGGNDKSLVSRTTVTKYLAGLSKSYSTQLAPDSKTRKFLYINYPLLELYEAAIGRSLANRIVLEVPDPKALRFEEGNYSRWMEENSYSVEVVVPASWSVLEVRARLLATLNSTFDLDGRLERRKVTCLVLTNPDGTAKCKSIGGKPVLSVGDSETENPGIRVRNKTIFELVRALNTGAAYYPGRPLIIDETGIDFPVDMELTATPGDIEGLKKAFTRYGLLLQSQYRETEVFVLSDNQKRLLNGF